MSRSQASAGKEKPIRIIPHKGERGHRTETRIFQREIWEHFCADPKCKFFGKHAAQGICHTRLGGIEQKYLDAVSKRAEDWLRESRLSNKKHKGTKDSWIKHLEATFVVHAMNEQFTLDELVRLRARLSEAELRASHKFSPKAKAI
jgi:hypothetical protein